MVHLLDPIVVRGIKLKNRVVMAPIGTGLATEKGEVTEKHLAYYKPRAREVSLVIVESCYVDVSGRLAAAQIGIHNDDLLPGLRKLVNVIHEAGAMAAIQINHGGGKCLQSVCGAQPVAPSSIKLWKETPRQLEASEIEQLVEKFGDAAQRVVDAGFDALEIHAAHGFLLNQFNSPLTNRRTDQYGGSLENRFRFSLEIVKEVRKRVGFKYSLLYRLGADDFTVGGLTAEESGKMAPEIVKAGIDLLDISSGLCGIYHPTNTSPGFFIPLAEEIKKKVSAPVIGVGGITTMELADQYVREERVDLVAIGRALMNDPDWGVKTMRSFKEKRDRATRLPSASR